MSITETIDFFKKLSKETNNKRELRIYKDFITMLSNLLDRNLSEEQLLQIEKEIETLNLKSNPENKKRFFSKKLMVFKQFLKAKFSLVPKGYYTNMGIGLGTSFGVLFGVVVLSSFERSLGVSLGIVAGMLIGLIIGHYMDSQVKEAGKVI
jgi:divalent metal cation (Fe/Co/Zn/Cd) transporter